MLFEEQISRKPNLYPWADDFVKTFHEGFWTSNEFSFKTDYAQFHEELTPEEQQLIVRNLSAISQIEISVKTFWGSLGLNLPHPSMLDLGYVMASTEVIHETAYSKLLDVLGLEHIFEENLKEPVLQGRVEYLRKYIKQYSKDEREQYIYSLILFGIFVENVSLFSQFYIGLFFNHFQNQLKDVSQQIGYTLHEENLHSQVAIKIINTLKLEYPEYFTESLISRITEECHLAIEYESKVIDWIVADYEHPYLNKSILKSYIKDRMNNSLKQIGFEHIEFDISQEDREKYKWMDEETYGSTKTDFFHKKPVAYAKSKKSYDDIF